MTRSKPSEKPSRVERLYASWLRLYPREHRRIYGPLMLQAFRDSYRDARTGRRRVGARFWLDVVRDEAASLAREHGSAMRERGERLKHRTVAIASGMLLSGGAFVYVVECIR